MSAALEYPVCVLPGCRTYVERVGEVCGECLSDFGPHLQPTGALAMTAVQITRRDDTVRAVYAERRGPQRETRRNQRCWMCEERRTCTRTPQGWECPTCQEIT